MKKRKITPFDKMLKNLGSIYTIERTNTTVNGFRHHDEHVKRNFIGFHCDVDVAVGDYLLGHSHSDKLHIDEIVTEYWIESTPHYNKAYYTTIHD